MHMEQTSLEQTALEFLKRKEEFILPHPPKHWKAKSNIDWLGLTIRDVYEGFGEKIHLKIDVWLSIGNKENRVGTLLLISFLGSFGNIWTCYCILTWLVFPSLNMSLFIGGVAWWSELLPSPLLLSFLDFGTYYSMVRGLLVVVLLQCAEITMAYSPMWGW